MKKRILIVEDEVLIANQLKYSLTAHGYECVGIAISYEKAMECLEKESLDLVLLDINIFGSKTGIDVANTINDKYHIPFIYLTSYTDTATLDLLKPTKPRAYLTKPINEVALTTTIDLVFINYKEEAKEPFILKKGNNTYKINLDELIYITTEHIYINLHLTTTTLLVRSSLTNMIKDLPITMLRISRGVAINPKFITMVKGNDIYMGDTVLTVSKNYKPQFLGSL